MTHWIASASARPVTRTLATLTAAAIVVVIGISPSLSQQPQQPAAPKAPAQPQQKAAPKPAAPAAQKGPAAPAAPGPAAAAQQMPPLIYTSWTKVCGKGPEANAKNVCQIGKEGRLESGLPMVSAVVIEMEGEPKKVLAVSLPPNGIYLPQGTRVVIDNDEQQAITGVFLTCVSGGCIAHLEATADTVARLKKGQQIYVQAYNMQRTVLTLSLPLADFAKAYDGPAVDPKTLEEQQKKLQDELQRRANEARQKLETQPGQPPAKSQ